MIIKTRRRLRGANKRSRRSGSSRSSKATRRGSRGGSGSSELTEEEKKQRIIKLRQQLRRLVSVIVSLHVHDDETRRAKRAAWSNLLEERMWDVVTMHATPSILAKEYFTSANLELRVREVLPFVKAYVSTHPERVLPAEPGDKVTIIPFPAPEVIDRAVAAKALLSLGAPQPPPSSALLDAAAMVSVPAAAAAAQTVRRIRRRERQPSTQPRPPSPPMSPSKEVVGGADLTPANVAQVLMMASSTSGLELTPTDLQTLIDDRDIAPPPVQKGWVGLNDILKKQLGFTEVSRPLRAQLLMAKIVIATWSTQPKLLSTARICERYNLNAADVEADLTLPAFIWAAREALKYFHFGSAARFVVYDVVVPLSEPQDSRISSYSSGGGSETIGTRMRFKVMDVESSTQVVEKNMEQEASMATLPPDEGNNKRKYHKVRSFSPEFIESMRQWIRLSWSQKVGTKVPQQQQQKVQRY